MASCPNDMFGFKKQHYTVGVNSQRQTLYVFFFIIISVLSSQHARQYGKLERDSSPHIVSWAPSQFSDFARAWMKTLTVLLSSVPSLQTWHFSTLSETNSNKLRGEQGQIALSHPTSFGFTSEKGFAGGAAALRQVLSRADAEWLCGRQLEAGRPSNGFRRSWYHGVCTGWVGKSIGNIHNIYELRSNTRQLGKGDAIAMCELCKLSQVWDRVCVKRERCRPESFA